MASAFFPSVRQTPVPRTHCPRWLARLGLGVFATGFALIALGASAAAQPDNQAQPAAAQPAAPDEKPGEHLSVSLVTFGPGDHPFFKFGHNAILIEDRDGRGAVYNFGMFDFSSPALIPKFILGRSHYWLGRTERDRTFAQYVEDNRTVEIDRLDLPPAARWDLLQRLEDNARPQNREYLYDYFTDNCSTRVRDALDRALGGRLRAAGEATRARLSYRGHALRLVEDVPWEYVALYYALGLPADLRASRWEESFVPMELRDLVRAVRVPGADGADRPLSSARQVIYQSSMPPPPLDPPRRLLRFLAPGTLLGAVLAGLGVAARRRRVARVGLALLSSLLGLVAGLCGLLLIFLWTATNHRASHANANILQSVPWAIALVFTGLGIVRQDGQRLRLAYRLAVVAVGASLLGLVARVSGLLSQDTDAFIALFLPVWMGLAFGLRTLSAIAQPRGPNTRRHPR